eukprot:gene14020-biopygen5736
MFAARLSDGTVGGKSCHWLHNLASYQQRVASQVWVGNGEVRLESDQLSRSQCQLRSECSEPRSGHVQLGSGIARGTPLAEGQHNPAVRRTVAAQNGGLATQWRQSLAAKLPLAAQPGGTEAQRHSGGEVAARSGGMAANPCQNHVAIPAFLQGPPPPPRSHLRSMTGTPAASELTRRRRHHCCRARQPVASAAPTAVVAYRAGVQDVANPECRKQISKAKLPCALQAGMRAATVTSMRKCAHKLRAPNALPTFN